MLTVTHVTVNGWSADAVVFPTERLRLTIAVRGIIGNSITTSAVGKDKQVAWKRAVMAAAKGVRGGAPLPNRALDVENFLKPTFDGLAAGLFCAEDTGPGDVKRFDLDDSGFRYLFAHRLSDAPSAATEGALLVVSAST